ncbi:DUF2508 family protein [Desulforamulus ferrireducens]|uniref:DUF2508 domain-containing protein n=1 Tax=Desulforamulus ferrireducens TaxID=1833852 RepID=A0A1S6IZA7_9FIRM|nr:DUF2508 family protein [Desulforamulus ferrireducens]AQS60104.1 DUF2508 domain-containing protein [Desulforamulus ferrireducens]
MRGDWQILQCILKGFSWQRLKKLIIKDNSSHKPSTLEEQIEQAKRAWQLAQEQMQWADKDLLEAAILNTTACERRYIALLQQAKIQGCQAWDDSRLQNSLGS